MHIKNTRCSFKSEESWDYIHFLYKILFKKKKGTGSSLLRYRLRRWRSVLRVLGVSLQASCLSPVAKGSVSLKPVWVLHKHTSHLHLFSWSLQPSFRARRTHGPPSVTTTFPLALYVFSERTVRGTNVQENTSFSLCGVYKLPSEIS